MLFIESLFMVFVLTAAICMPLGIAAWLADKYIEKLIKKAESLINKLY